MSDRVSDRLMPIHSNGHEISTHFYLLQNLFLGEAEREGEDHVSMYTRWQDEDQLLMNNNRMQHQRIDHHCHHSMKHCHHEITPTTYFCQGRN